jgi:hypothetical protein
MRTAFLVVAVTLVVGGPLPTTAQAPAKPDDPPLRIELTAAPLAVKFVNTGKEPLRVLKPIDGSEWCWIMPYYKLTVVDDRDREVGFAERCKLYGAPYFDTRWPDDYVVTIQPGKSYTRPLSHNHALRTEGTYRVRFEYRFEPKTDDLPGSADAKYPPGLWRGSAISNAVEVRLKPN